MTGSLFCSWESDYLYCWKSDYFCCWESEYFCCWESDYFCCWESGYFCCWESEYFCCWESDFCCCWESDYFWGREYHIRGEQYRISCPVFFLTICVPHIVTLYTMTHASCITFAFWPNKPVGHFLGGALHSKVESFTSIIFVLRSRLNSEVWWTLKIVSDLRRGCFIL